MLTRTDRTELWAPAYTVLAAEQIVLPRAPTTPSTVGGPATVTTVGDVTHRLLKAAPVLCLWRALTDNDRSFALDNRFVRSGFFTITRRAVEVEHELYATLVHTRYSTAWGEDVLHRRRIAQIPDGFRFEEKVELPIGTEDGLRVGMEFAGGSLIPAAGPFSTSTSPTAVWEPEHWGPTSGTNTDSLRSHIPGPRS